MQGKQGETGLPGEKGDRGERGGGPFCKHLNLFYTLFLFSVLQPLKGQGHEI